MKISKKILKVFGGLGLCLGVCMLIALMKAGWSAVNFMTIGVWILTAYIIIWGFLSLVV
jgi:hypothetical protein